jgi:hypothetical protein
MLDARGHIALAIGQILPGTGFIMVSFYEDDRLPFPRNAYVFFGEDSRDWGCF